MPNIRKDDNSIKSRLIVLAKMFYKETDEEHQMTNLEILDYLEEHNVPANEKTLRGDIRLLQEMGFDIVTVVSRPNRYFQDSREFTIAELKVLIDAVASSRFITQKKSHDLGMKLAELASENQRAELKRNVYSTNRVKNSNEAIYGMVDLINAAINMKRTITFQYRDYTGELKPTLRNNGEVYELSPYALFWNSDYYYVVGWSEKHGNVSTFRADRLVDPVITSRRAAKKPEEFNLDVYSKRIFEMFDGEPTEVTLEVKDEFAKYIVDRFGTAVKTEPVADPSSETTETEEVDPAEAKNQNWDMTWDEAEFKSKRKRSSGYFRVTVNVSLSPTFYAWVFQFGGEVRILSPERAVNEIESMAAKLLDREHA